MRCVCVNLYFQTRYKVSFWKKKWKDYVSADAFIDSKLSFSQMLVVIFCIQSETDYRLQIQFFMLFLKKNLSETIWVKLHDKPSWIKCQLLIFMWVRHPAPKRSINRNYICSYYYTWFVLLRLIYGVPYHNTSIILLHPQSMTSLLLTLECINVISL